MDRKYLIVNTCYAFLYLQLSIFVCIFQSVPFSLSLFLYPYRPLYLAFVCLYVCSSEQSHWASAHIFKYQILICEW